jgi:hypothetical protein
LEGVVTLADLGDPGDDGSTTTITRVAHAVLGPRRSELGGGVPPIGNGMMLLSGMLGGPFATDAVPWARITVP